MKLDVYKYEQRKEELTVDLGCNTQYVSVICSNLLGNRPYAFSLPNHLCLHILVVQRIQT